MRRPLLLLVVIARGASAQPAPPCDVCKDGDALIDKFGLGAIRPLAAKLPGLAFREPLSEAQYAEIVAFRAKTPILGRLAALDDTDLELVAIALCRSPGSDCVKETTFALRCLADRCEVALPHQPPKDTDVIVPVPECTPPERKKTPLLGVGVDWGHGVQRDRAANDGRVTSLGISARIRFSDRLGMIARADRTDGRDEATDADRDGVDDFRSSSITRFVAMAGPSFVLDSTKFERSTRSVRLDLLAGYMATRTLPDEDGLAVGADLAMQLSGFRTGLRVIQGFGDAKSATMVLVHFGVSAGSTPTHREEEACPPKRRSSRLALGFELPFTGGGFSSQLGYVGSSRVDLQACKLEYSIVSPK